MNNYCTFYIVRHAQSQANALHIRAGQMDFDLSEKGIEQAKERAKDLQLVDFDAAFSSDLTRARKTAEIIALEHKLVVITSQMLRERNFGDRIQGKTSEETKHLLAEYNKILSFHERQHIRPLPEMETDAEVVSRVLTYFREIAIAYPNKTVLVVAHRNMMMQLLFHLGFAEIPQLVREKIQPTSYFVLRSDGLEFEVVKTVGIEKVTSY